MRVLVLGGSGFIGSAAVSEIVARGHAVTILARDPSQGAQRQPHAQWIKGDLSRMTRPEDWRLLLSSGVDAILNCAGALQDGPRDNVAAVQDQAMQALYKAAAAHEIRLIVQVSAEVAGGEANATPFLASKHAADAALAASGIPYIILRPAMVIGRNAYGGSALLRGLAAFPLLTPLTFGDAPVQFTALEDCTRAIADALEGRIPPNSDLAIMDPEALTLTEAVARHRAWLGLPKTRAVNLPDWTGGVTSAIADFLGKLGWRSPLRSTAMIVAKGGVINERSEQDILPSRTLDETLTALPAGVQDVWFARFWLLKPIIFTTLSLFWIASGTIALLKFNAASAILAETLPPWAAKTATLATSLLDIALGVGVAFRTHAKTCLLGIIAVSSAYLAGSLVLTPAMWLDPVGPLVKVFPAIVLTLAALAILDER